MTRKDYVLIAACLAAVRADCTADKHREHEFAALDAVARDLAHQLANDNPRFDRARFLAACGVAGNYTEN